MPEAKPPILPSSAPSLRKAGWRNHSSQKIEIRSGVWLGPGEFTTIRPENLDFFLEIGAIKPETPKS